MKEMIASICAIFIEDPRRLNAFQPLVWTILITLFIYREKKQEKLRRK